MRQRPLSLCRLGALKLALFHWFAPGLDGFVYGIANDDAIDGGGVAGFDGLQGAVLEDKVALFKGNGAGGFVAGQVGEIRVVLLDLVDIIAEVDAVDAIAIKGFMEFLVSEGLEALGELLLVFGRHGNPTGRRGDGL